MTLTYFLLLLVPIVAFVAVDAFAGLRAGVISAMILGILAFVANILITGIFEWSSAIEPTLIIALGLVTLQFKDARYFKFQPVVTNVALAILLLYYQLFDTPFLQKYMPLFSKALPPETHWLIENPKFLEAMGLLSLHLIYLFLLHAALVAWAALRANNWWWLAARLAGYPMMFGLMTFNLLPLARSLQQ
jgi:intracellular septation protein A